MSTPKTAPLRSSCAPCWPSTLCWCKGKGRGGAHEQVYLLTPQRQFPLLNSRAWHVNAYTTGPPRTPGLSTFRGCTELARH